MNAALRKIRDELDQCGLKTYVVAGTKTEVVAFPTFRRRVGTPVVPSTSASACKRPTTRSSRRTGYMSRQLSRKGTAAPA